MNVATVVVGVLGDAAPRVQPHQSLQFYAKAADASGKSVDVTNSAKWASSNIAVASVSPAGIVTGVGQGTATVSATYLQVPGQIEATVFVPTPVASPSSSCAASTVTPAAMVYSASGYMNCSDDGGVYGQKLHVTAAQPSCRWTATVNVPWLGIDCYSMNRSYTPPGPGTGDLWYAVQANNTTASRNGHIDIRFTDGSSTSHTVTQEAPGCSYVINPATSSVPADGGTGSFDLIVTPSSCSWRYRVPSATVQLTPSTGVGSQHIAYHVSQLTSGGVRTTRWDILIDDPDDRYPQAEHLVTAREP
jgi:hypothetical protein